MFLLYRFLLSPAQDLLVKDTVVSAIDFHLLPHLCRYHHYTFTIHVRKRKHGMVNHQLNEGSAVR